MRGYLLKDGRRSGRWVRRWVEFNESSGELFTHKAPDDGERPKLLASLFGGATISMVEKSGKPCIAIVPGDGHPRYLAAAAGEQPPLHSWFHRMQSAILRSHQGGAPAPKAARAPARERRGSERGQQPHRDTPLQRARHSVQATTARVVDAVDQVRCRVAHGGGSLTCAAALQQLLNVEKADIIRDDTEDLAEESNLFSTRAQRAAERMEHVSARGPGACAT